MNDKMPRTPFSTPLSGSAREAKIRLKHIFSGIRRRPPALFLALVFALCLLCGNLVSCQQRPAVPSIVMQTQYYDSYSNCVEIPMLALPAGEENTAVEAINQALAQLGQEYEWLKDSAHGGNCCVLYPSTTQRYLNLVFFENANSYGNDGNIQTWVYDKKNGSQVTGEEALALADTSLEALFSQLEEVITNDPEDPRKLYPETPDPIVLLGFRIKADGRPVFYLSAYVDGRELEGGSYLDEWARLYVWDEEEFSRYSCMFIGHEDEYPLVPAGETDRLDPPLWNQWYFAGEEPEGGFIPRYVPGEDPFGGNFYTVLMEQIPDEIRQDWNVYYDDNQTDRNQAGDLRVGPVSYLGEVSWDEAYYAAAYQVCYTFYGQGPQGLDWHASHEIVVLSRSAGNGLFQQLLGRRSFEPDGMDIWEIVRQAIGE